MKEEANKIVFKTNKIFTKYFSNTVISKLSSIIKEYRAQPDELLIKMNNDSDSDKCIYFI